MVNVLIRKGTKIPGLWLYLHCVKPVALIMYFLLSFLSGGRPDFAADDAPAGSPGVVSENHSSEKTADYSPGRDFCITASQGYSFAGSDSTNSVTGRTTQSGRRIHPQVRSGSRIVKGGKVIDNNHQHPFLARSVVHLTGAHVPERYLFSICRLRL